jgi:hypothetical protein
LKFYFLKDDLVWQQVEVNVSRVFFIITMFINLILNMMKAGKVDEDEVINNIKHKTIELNEDVSESVSKFVKSHADKNYIVDLIE